MLSLVIFLSSTRAVRFLVLAYLWFWSWQRFQPWEMSVHLSGTEDDQNVEPKNLIHILEWCDVIFVSEHKKKSAGDEIPKSGLYSVNLRAA